VGALGACMLSACVVLRRHFPAGPRRGRPSWAWRNGPPPSDRYGQVGDARSVEGIITHESCRFSQVVAPSLHLSSSPVLPDASETGPRLKEVRTVS
jgi:hypothetical protein